MKHLGLSTTDGAAAAAARLVEENPPAAAAADALVNEMYFTFKAALTLNGGGISSSNVGNVCPKDVEHSLYALCVFAERFKDGQNQAELNEEFVKMLRQLFHCVQSRAKTLLASVSPPPSYF